MSGICGWLGFARADAAGERLIDRMAEPLKSAHTETTRTWVLNESAVGGASIRDNIHLQETDGGIVAVYGREYPHDPARPVNLARKFLQHYPGEGHQALCRFDGPFALAYISERDGEALLAVDRMAVYPLSYALSGGTLVFGSSADALRRHPGVSVELDPQALFNYIYFHVIPGPGTVYKQVRRVPAGGYIHLKNGQIATGRYWQPAFSEPRHPDKKQLARRFNDILAAQARGAAEHSRAGCFLSGGTDSSSVTGYAQQAADHPIPSYSIGFDAEGFDESHYARLAAARFRTDHHEYYLTPGDVTAGIPAAAARYDQPFGNASAVAALGCARLARSCGTERLLAGDGGDELFGGNQRYAKQMIFAVYDRIPSGIRKPLVDPLADILPNGFLPLRKIRRYIEQARLPMPDRMEGHNLLQYFGAETIFNAEFLSSVDQQNPAGLLREFYEQAGGNNLLNSMLGLDFKITLVDSDLPKVTEMCDLAGVEAAFPMLANEMIDFSTALPARYKLKGRRLRPFFKDALKHHLPAEIINKKKHGFGLPFGHWASNDAGLRELVFDSLESLKGRHIVRPDFIDALANRHMPAHPAYFGVLVWVMVMLEQWFEQRQ